MNNLEKEYRRRFETVLEPIAHALEEQLLEYMRGVARIDRVTARAKGVSSFLKKATALVEGKPKYAEPLEQIQDQIGARVITFYASDVEGIAEKVTRYYRPIERKLHVPDSEWEFGYFGRHFILLLPTDCVTDQMDRSEVPTFFELQIKTLFQHAWSEAGHDLGYKPGETPLTSDQKRRLAFTSAQAWGADRIFDELFQERAVGISPLGH
jgi:putative GTP pyrophosphokinase